jgi:integrase
MRLSEVLKLHCEDVDLEQGVLTIRQTKFLKSRHVMLHSSTTRALERYARERARDPASARAEHFFAIDDRPLSVRTMNYVFDQLRRRLGWRGRGDRPRPRIHDLRFTFICRRVERWYAEGCDVSHLMLSLSTYVGHVLPSATYWYLTATPQLMARAARRASGPSGTGL